MQVEGRSPTGERFPFAVHSVADQHVSPAIAAAGEWEPFTTRILASMLQPGDSVLDIGANIGWYSVVLGRIVGPTGHVLAFEPDSTNAEVLRRNIELNSLPQVVVHQCALADRQGMMSLARSDVNLGDHRLAPTEPGATSDREQVSVPVRRLDDVIEEAQLKGTWDAQRLRVTKMDTQGAEVMILRGAPRLWADLPQACAVVIEFAPNMLAQHEGDQVNEFVEFVTQTNRALFTIRKSSIAPTTAAKLLRLAEKLQTVGDEWAVDVLIAPADAAQAKRLNQFRGSSRRLLSTFSGFSARQP